MKVWVAIKRTDCSDLQVLNRTQTISGHLTIGRISEALAEDLYTVRHHALPLAVFTANQRWITG